MGDFNDIALLDASKEDTGYYVNRAQKFVKR